MVWLRQPAKPYTRLAEDQGDWHEIDVCSAVGYINGLDKEIDKVLNALVLLP